MATLSPELALLAACCLAEDSELATSARLLAQSGLNWERFEQLARFHGVCGMVGARLGTVSPGTLPQDLASRFRHALRQDAAAQIADTAEAVRLCAMLEDAGIRVLVLKGSALAHMLYAPNPEWRGSTDIDLLIAESDLDRADALLRSTGIERAHPDSLPPIAWRDMFLLLDNVFDYLSARTGRKIELHFRPTANPHCVPVGFDELHAQSCQVNTISGPLRGLAGPAFLGYLCWHALGEFDFRLKWLSDLVRMKQMLGAATCQEAIAAGSGTKSAAEAMRRPAAVCDDILSCLSDAAESRQWQHETRRILHHMEQAKATPIVRTFARLPTEVRDLRFKLKLTGDRPSKHHFLLRTLCDPRDVAALGLPARYAWVYALMGPLLALWRLTRRHSRIAPARGGG